MQLIAGNSLGQDSDQTEANALKYSPDTFGIRQMQSGRWAVYDNFHLVAFLDDLNELPAAAAHAKATRPGRTYRPASKPATKRKPTLAGIDLSNMKL